MGRLEARVVEPNTIAIDSLAADAGPETDTEGVVDELLSAVEGWGRERGYRTLLLAADRVPSAIERHCRARGFTAVDASSLPAELGILAATVLRRDLAGVVALRDPDPSWPAQFERERQRIAGALGPAALAIEHTGSTSVPGLAAKPIIDITLTVPDPADEAAYVPALERAGYTFTLREPEWYEHRLLNRDWPRVNLHVFGDGCPEVRQMVGFRDWLRAHPEDRDLYETAKRTLAAREWAIVQDYADAKTDVVMEIKRRAGLLAG